jgi:hypothetical protein
MNDGSFNNPLFFSLLSSSFLSFLEQPQKGGKTKTKRKKKTSLMLVDWLLIYFLPIGWLKVT